MELRVCFNPSHVSFIASIGIYDHSLPSLDSTLRATIENQKTTKHAWITLYSLIAGMQIHLVISTNSLLVQV